MSALFHVTIRSEDHGEVIEFDSTQPVLHIAEASPANQNKGALH